MQRRRSKKKTANTVLIFLAIFLLAFVITMIAVFMEKDAVPDTLITCVFAACTGELSVLGWIKTTKEKKDKSKEEDDDGMVG